jgi:cell fate (sporulation/competence/biofilm development) regulator YlbF (YheA/YmcA/DUF963 family)
MAVVTSKDPIFDKTVELCREILDHPKFSRMQETIQAFLNNADTRAAYENVIQLGDQLDQKQNNGTPLTQPEIDAYEAERDKLLADPIASEFLKVQREIHKVQETVNQYVAKTFELGRVPEDSDFEEGSCGPSCGCS